MVQNTIDKIEEMIRSNSSLTEKNKKELLDLLLSMKPEIAALSKTKNEHAESIAGFMERSTHEVLRQEKNPSLIKIAIDGLKASVKDFELSHPKLSENVYYIANTLSNMGI